MKEVVQQLDVVDEYTGMTDGEIRALEHVKELQDENY